jgi:hypothetical protein
MGRKSHGQVRVQERIIGGDVIVNHDALDLFFFIIDNRAEDDSEPVPAVVATAI